MGGVYKKRKHPSNGCVVEIELLLRSQVESSNRCACRHQCPYLYYTPSTETVLSVQKDKEKRTKCYELLLCYSFWLRLCPARPPPSDTDCWVEQDIMAVMEVMADTMGMEDTEDMEVDISRTAMVTDILVNMAAMEDTTVDTVDTVVTAGTADTVDTEDTVDMVAMEEFDPISDKDLITVSLHL
uniref:Uncharacterized protein n=1 Tax=Anopheles gambiae TaxID=7165 RepID=A0A453Z0Q1_ANOGA